MIEIASLDPTGTGIVALILLGGHLYLLYRVYKCFFKDSSSDIASGQGAPIKKKKEPEPVVEKTATPAEASDELISKTKVHAVEEEGGSKFWDELRQLTVEIVDSLFKD